MQSVEYKSPAISPPHFHLTPFSLSSHSSTLFRRASYRAHITFLGSLSLMTPAGNLNGATVTQQGEPGVIVQQGGAVIVQQAGGASPIVQRPGSPVVQQTIRSSGTLVVQQSATVVVQQPNYPVSPPVPVPPPGKLAPCGS